jgi:hypothetical protein
MKGYIIFSFLHLALTAIHYVPPPKGPAPKGIDCSSKKTKDEVLECGLNEEAMRILRRLKEQIAMSNHDSKMMVVNTMCVKEKMSECKAASEKEAAKARWVIGKNFDKIYPSIKVLVKEAIESINEKKIPLEEAVNTLSAGISSAYDKIAKSAKGPISDGIQKREITIDDKPSTEAIADIDKTDLQKRNFVGSFFLKASQSISLNGIVWLGKEIVSLMARAIFMLKEVIPKLLQAVLKPFKWIVSKIAQPFTLVDDAAKLAARQTLVRQAAVRNLPSLVKPSLTSIFLKEAGQSTFWMLSVGYAINPKNGPLYPTLREIVLWWKNSTGQLENNTDKSEVALPPDTGEYKPRNLDKEKCKAYHPEIYDKERDYRWFFNCDALSYYRLDEQSGKFILYSENSDRCTAGDSNTTLFTCQKS